MASYKKNAFAEYRKRSEQSKRSMKKLETDAKKFGKNLGAEDDHCNKSSVFNITPVKAKVLSKEE